MPSARTNSFSLRPDNKPLLLALAIATGIHVILVYGAVSLAVLSVLFSDKKDLADLHRMMQPNPNLTKPQEPTLLFVQVDPAQVSEAPKNPKFYSSQSTTAANPDSEKDTDTPKIDGTQTHVPKTETTPRPSFPLQP